MQHNRNLPYYYCWSTSSKRSNTTLHPAGRMGEIPLAASVGHVRNLVFSCPSSSSQLLITNWWTRWQSATAVNRIDRFYCSDYYWLIFALMGAVPKPPQYVADARSSLIKVRSALHQETAKMKSNNSNSYRKNSECHQILQYMENDDLWPSSSRLFLKNKIVRLVDDSFFLLLIDLVFHAERSYVFTLAGRYIETWTVCQFLADWPIDG